MLTTKENVLTIAPQLHNLIYGTPQKTRIYVQNLNDNTLIVDDVEYIYEVEEGDTIADIISGLVELIDADEAPIVTVVNETTTYFDVRGVYTVPYVISEPTHEILVESLPDNLWDLFSEDVESIVNEDTFVDMVERAQRYLMAHLLTIYSMNTLSNSVLSSEKVGDISVSYADPLSDEAISATGFGAIYHGIYMKNRRIRYT